MVKILTFVKMTVQNILITDALNTDLPDIIELLEELNLDLEDVHYSQFKVAKNKGEVIAVGRLHSYENGLIELSSVGVLEEFRNQKIGSRIVQALLEKEQADEIFLLTDIITFFEKFGFKNSTEMPEVLEDKFKRCIEQYQCEKAQVMRWG